MIKTKSVTKLGEGEKGMGLPRTPQSNASLDKSHISGEAVSGRVKAAAGEGWAGVTGLTEFFLAGAWSGHTAQVCLGCLSQNSAKNTRSPPVPLGAFHSWLPPSSPVTSWWQTPRSSTVAPWQEPSVGPNWEKLEPCQVQHRQLLVAGVGFPKG